MEGEGRERERRVAPIEESGSASVFDGYILPLLYLSVTIYCSSKNCDASDDHCSGPSFH